MKALSSSSPDGKAVLLMTTANRKSVGSHGKDQHVVPHENGWAVRGEGNSRATRVTSTKKEAIGIAREISRNQHSELFIHGRNGSLQNRDSHGHDPFPPKG
jgi:hypothetical protein